MDTQQVEIIGRNLLISACVADNLEVAEPLRDRGIDIIIFDDGAHQDTLKALPVQLKASRGEGFSVHAKYSKFPTLLMAYTWHSGNPVDAELYIMTYKDALAIARSLGWLDTASWLDGGGYSTQSPSTRLRDSLKPFLYKKGSIRSLLTNC